ncbi:N-acetylmuramoyl-L-alanine amidase [Caloramator australicus]|uniref:N-acetylmuramoyl-L-alanine amidase n=1 Tax=Caloramator australicus RC3 TaxID=857293 RepID=I7LI40_9CLOT|nr:N-acetylmuramoyl-L-alanine amidase [Caloramator australicus]CCJ32642.1 N-acetylmuramoyl-L-alanine amidase [Caloramator australicus RC3]
MKILKKIVAGLIFLSFNINTVFAGVLSGKRIVIDPGHGGSDPGAVSGQVREKDINNSVARKLADLLKAEGAEVIFTREPEKDIYITLADRVNISNSINPDLFISIHNNASISSAANGVETYYSLVRPNILSSKYAEYAGDRYPVLRESRENNINYVYMLMGDEEIKVEKTKVKIVYKYVEYEGNKYECLRESRENDIDYVYILVNGKEVKVEKNKVKIVYSPNPWQALESKSIAEIIVNNLASLGFKYRGAKDSNLYVTRNTTSPSVLLELGFITNPDDRQKLIDPIYQESIAQKILQSLLSYYEVYENNKIKAFGMPEKTDLVLSKDKILLGDSIDFTFKGIEDTLLKKVEIKYLDEVVASSEAQFTFTPNKDGEFEAILYLKSPDSVNEYDEVISKKFNVYKYPTIKNIILSPDNPTSKNNITISIEKENGSLVGCDYTFEIYKGERIILSGTSDKNVINFIPNEDGEYKVIIKLKDKLSKNEYDDIKEASFIVRPEEAASRGTNTQNQTTQVINGMFKINRVLKRGMIGEDVRELQRALIKLGYLKISTPTITFGPSTETAVKAFQRANRLNADGIVGKTTADIINLNLARLVNNTQVSRGSTNQNATNNQLLKITRVLKKGMTGEDVRELQRALIRLGYLKISTPTTTFGPTTEAAVKAFQRANRLNADGIVGKTTVDKINSLLKNRF